MRVSWRRSLKATLDAAGYRPGDPLVVGVSGGADSIALLHQLCSQVRPDLLQVVHLDHGIRPDAAADAQFVADIAGRFGAPFFLRRRDVPAFAAREGLSLEEAARIARYQFLGEVAQEVGAPIVAAGHHLDDQVETVLLNLLRGSGLRGLRGMQPVSPFPGPSRLTLIRPLLSQTRAEVEAYCAEQGLRYVIDETNADPRYTRNWIRHHLLPQLADRSPQIKRQMVQLSAIAAADDAFLESLAEEAWTDLLAQQGSGWLCLDRGRFQALPLALQRRTMRRAVEALHPDTRDLSFSTVEQALKIATRQESGLETMLPGGIALLADYDLLVFSTAAGRPPTRLPQLDDAQRSEILSVPGEIALANGWVLAAELTSAGEQEIDAPHDPWQEYVDVGDQRQLVVRARQTGERLQPLGLHGHSTSLQDFMVDRKLSARLRAGWPLVVAGEHLVWLTGYMIDHRARVRENSVRIVKLRCKRMGDGA